MRHYDDLDQDIRDLGTKKASATDGGLLLHMMRKLAMPGEPAPDADLAQHAQEVATGEEASPAEAELHTEAGAPDVSGHLEGEFAVPVEQVVTMMASIVSNSMRQHAAYAYYGEMMRGLGRGELSELFEEQGQGELEEMHYFLRRMGVLQPGGVPIPPPPTPQPSSNPEDALNFLVAGEQQAIVYFKALHAMLGENPMKYTIEQTMTSAQEHLDKLWQYMPEGKAEKKASVSVKEKIASAIGKIKRAEVATSSPSAPASEEMTPSKPRNGTAPEPGSSPAKTLIPQPGAEPIEQYLLREQQMQLQQNEGEKQEMAAQLGQYQQMAVANQAAAEEASASAQQNAQQAEMAGQQAAEATQSAQVAQEAATQGEANAAAQAEGKMRLGIRINQLRQQLADIVSSDPVTEEGMGGGEQPGAGSVMTAQQQGAAAEEQAANDQLAQEQIQAQQVGGGKAKKEVAQAQRATQEADVQQTQAQVAEGAGA